MKRVNSFSIALTTVNVKILSQDIDTIARQSSNETILGNTYSFSIIIIIFYQLEKHTCAQL